MKYLAFLLFVAAVFVFHNSARAGAYSLEIIAQAGDVIDGRTLVAFANETTNVSINNDGEVAFFAWASGPDGQGWSAMTQHRFIAGAGKLVDGRVPEFNDEDHFVEMNNRGQVTYSAFLPGGRGIFVDQTLIVASDDVFDGRRIIFLGRHPAISDAGTVAFFARHTDDFNGPDALFTQDGVLVETGQTIDGYTVSGLLGPQITFSNSGEIAFRLGMLDATGGKFEAIATPDRIILKEGIDTVGGLPVIQLRDFAGISDSGEILFSAASCREPCSEPRMVASQDRVFLEYPGVVDGIRMLGIRSSDIAANNSLEFAFNGTFEREDGELHKMLFANGQRILAEGDIFDGKVIKRIRNQFDINDHGDVAFRAVFEEGGEAVFVARPIIPEPDALMLAAMGLIALLHVAQRRSPRAARRRAARPGEGP